MPAQPKETVEPFGPMLRRLRERAGLTQQELAERADLTPHAVSALERGMRTRPYPHTVRSLAEALGVSDEERTALIAAVPSRRSVAPPAEDSPSAATDTAESALPAAGSVRAPGLVVPPTRLYGRDADVRTVADLARAGTSRLVTLTGPGGVGKTRLAAALSEELAVHYPDGVVQVSLAPLGDAADMFSTIGRAVGAVGSDGPDALDAVAAHLRQLRFLLVLDNFEHLLSAAADVARLTSLCPHLTVLVTSRSPLRVRAETEYPVAPLELPPTDTETIEQLGAAPAGALVLDRARAGSPGLELSSDDLRALGELCHRLAGLPLAIELATAHLRLLTPRAVLERLDDATSAFGARDLPERQRTMRATLDWSYGLLSADQQRLFTLLGVFRGGTTLEALEAVVAACEEVPPGDVLGLLTQLVEQSLVVVRPGRDGANRYDMLEPVAQYSRSLLVGDRAARAGRAHAEVFATLARRAASGYEQADQVTWLARTDADEANLRVAVERALDLGDGEMAGRITWSMWLYWWLRGELTVGRRLSDQCLATELPPRLRGRVHLAGATMAYAAGDIESGAAHWREALLLAEQEQDPEVACKATSGVGLVALAAGDLVTAETRFREALDLGREAGPDGVWLRSLTHVWLGTSLMLRAEHEPAVTEIERGLELARERGDRLSTYVALYNLSQAAIATGDHARAHRLLVEGIGLSEQTRDLANLAHFLEALAVVESQAGRQRRVAVLLGAARSLRDTVGANVYAYYVPDETLRVAAEEAAREVLGEEYDAAVSEGRGLDAEAAIGFALGPADG